MCRKEDLYPTMIYILIVLFFPVKSFADTAKSQYGCDIIKDGLVAWYPFDGDTQDKSGNQNHGEAKGNLTFAAGKIGQAAKFDGHSSYITVSHHDSLNLLGFTLSAWVYDYQHPVSDNDISTILIMGSKEKKYKFSSSSYNKEFAHFEMFDSKYQDQDQELLQSEHTISINQWKHIAVIYDGHYLIMYIDGKFDNAIDAGIPFFIDGNYLPLTIGAVIRDDNSPVLSVKDGLIDDLRIYNRVLSESEIGQLYECANTSPQKTDQSPNECVIDLNNNKHTCQDVSAITFISQPMNNQAVVKISFDPKLYKHNKAIFEVTYDKQPTGWTVDICDSKSCDGYGGDAGHTSNAAEVEVVGKNFNAYRNTLHGHPDSTGETLRLFGKPVSINHETMVSLEISNERLDWKFPNENGKLESDRLFTLGSVKKQPDHFGEIL